MMSMITVRFRYLTGVKASIFSNVRLKGSWDEQGRYSEHWSTIPMQPVQGEDGCPAFEAVLQVAADQVGRQFQWGVLLDGPSGKDVWAVPSEIKDHRSMSRYRTFELRPPVAGITQEECYYLNHSRRLGAQKHLAHGHQGIRFSVWAPNARKVEVVMGKVFDVDDPQRTPVDAPMPRERIAGGHIADDGAGMHDNLGPFEMRKSRQPECPWDGIWVTDASDPQLMDFRRFDHRPYMFRVTKDDGEIAYRTDLYSRCQIGFGDTRPEGGEYTGLTADLDGTISCSVVVDPDRVTRQFTEPNWPESEWVSAEEFWQEEFSADRPLPQTVEDLVIYELHLGALGYGHEGPGTMEDALKFLDHLEKLGVNAVEFLPMSEYGGGVGGWGYSTSHYYAIEYSGGGRDQFKWFVRQCHRRGIAVIMDVVYNHYNHDATRAEWLYDTNSHENNIYYWYEGQPSDYPAYQQAVPPQAREHGGYVDNLSTAWAPRYHEEMVRKMFISSAVALALEFHVDGFRMDQTTSIHAYNVRHADGRPVASANAFGAKLLRELTRTLKMVRPNIMLMAEDHSEWDKVTVNPDEGGLGFDATWYANFYHHLIGDTDKGSDFAKLLKTAGLGDDRPLAMSYFAGTLARTGDRRVVYHESHDEAGNGKFTHRSIVTAVNSAPLHNGASQETRRYAEARCRFAAGMALLSAGTPMFLFGEEVGSEKDFKYGEVLENREDLEAERETSGKHLFRFYSDLIQLRRRHAGLRSREIEVVHVHDANRVLAFRRWQDDDEFLVIASLSNHGFAEPNYQVHHPQLPKGRWREVFNSDSQAYGGWNIGNQGGEVPSQDRSIAVAVPPNGFVVFQRV